MLVTALVAGLFGASPMYVQASRLNVRRAPDAKAKIVARLAIGMKVEVGERKAGFVRIERKRVKGWASEGLLTDKPVRLNELLLKFEAAQTLADKRSWIERAAALAPRNKEVLQHLARVLEEAKDTKALSQARLGLAAAAGEPNHDIHLVHLGEFASEDVTLVPGSYAALAVLEEGLKKADIAVVRVQDPTDSGLKFVKVQLTSGPQATRYIVDRRPIKVRLKAGAHARRIKTPKVDKRTQKAELEFDGVQTNLRYINHSIVEKEPGAKVKRMVYALQVGRKWHNFECYGGPPWLADFDGDGKVDVLTDLAQHYAVAFDEELWLSSLSDKSLIEKAAWAKSTAL